MTCKLCGSEKMQVLLIVTVYVVFSTLWIYVSDRLLFLVIAPQLRTNISIYKGEAFVLLSAGLLYLLIVRYARRLKEASSAGEKRFRLIADYMPGFVWTIRPDGTVDFSNKFFKEFTGLESYNDTSFVHPDDRALTEAIWRKAMQTGTPYEVEHRFRRHDGVYRWYLCRAVPERDAAGKIVRWYGTSTDIDDLKTTSEALRSRTAELESLLAHAPIGFAFFDQRHRYLRVNRALCLINGLREEEMLGKTIQEVLPVNARAADPILDQVFRSGLAVEAEIAGETPKEPGVERYWLTGFYPVFASAKEPIAVGAYVVEITERKRAEEAMSRLAAIVRAAEDAVFSEDLNGIVQTWNRGAEKLFGYSAEEMIGKPISLVIPPELTSELKEMTRKTKQGLQDHYETVRLTKGGKRIFVFLTMSPMRDAAGQIVGVAKIVRDISDKKRAEEDLKETVKALQRTNHELQQFAHVASHDLQEPLRNVTRYMELFFRNYQDRIDEKGRIYINFAMEGANRIHALVSDLLSYSELGVSAREFRPVSMHAVAEEAMDNLRHTMEESRAVVLLDELPEVMGNRRQLVQLLQNLLSNALKFGRSGISPRISISAERLTGNWRFGVHDNGIGIEPEYFDKIFVIFQRLHARSKHPGTGIGLAICRKIVELHGGRIWVESRLGEGSIFYFTIPARGGTDEGHGNTAGGRQ
ncbi:PAS domain S-box protein [Geotalea sp. SG265]|uniref:PAS domain S-box protein n=1 Tax=Geotalea sp. SG265 TaxID=2922867 RepID=UPI001FAFD0B0|nr:PAS domain S-box protein [Geotalea sp. SG265]